MKSLIHWIAACTLLFIFGSQVQAQTVTLVGDVSGPIGTETTIQLVTSDLTGLGITALDFTIEYDRSKVFIFSAAEGPVILNSNANLQWNNLSGGKNFQITSATGSAFTGSGVIATLSVKIVGGSGTNASGISFNTATYSIPPNTAPFTATDVASVTVTGGTPITVTIPAQNQLINTAGVVVPVSITDIAKYGIFSYTLVLDYDDTYFEIVGATNPGGAYSNSITPNFGVPGRATIVGTLNNGENLSKGLIAGGPGTLVNLTFNFKGNVVVNTPLEFDIALTRFDAGLPLGDFVNTTVTVTQNNPVPTLASVAPNTALAGDPATAVVLTGTNFVANSVVRINGADIATTFVNGTTLNATIPAPNLVNAAVLNVTVFNPAPMGGTSNAVPFTVGNPAPVPSGMSVGAFFWGENTNATVTGTAIFNGATMDAGAGVSFLNYNYAGAPTSANFDAFVTPGTAIGIRPLTIENIGSGAVNVPGDVDIRYKAPTFTQIVPNSGVQGTTFNVQIQGSSFFDETIVKTALNLGAGITVNTVTIDNFNLLTANITIDPAAAVGPRDVTLTNVVNGTSGGTDIEVGAFSVILDGNPVPTATSINPDNGRQGETLNVTVTGTNFGAFTSVSFGANIISNSVTVNNATSVTVNISIAGNAALGARDVTVTNAAPGGGVVVLDDAFTVNPPLNQAPIANNDLYTTPFNTQLIIGAPGVLTNDSDDDGIGNLTAQLVTGPANGSVSLANNGGFTYTPAQGFSGIATFTYRAIDGDAAQSNVATVTISVGGAQNSPPLANDDNYNTGAGQTLTVPAPGFLGNDVDDGGIGNLQAQVINPAPGNVGTITIGTNGSILYVPAANYSGTFEFTYRATDGNAATSNLAVVRITVAGAQNSAPTANDDNYAVASGSTLTVTVPGILGNDTDDGGQANLTAEVVQTNNMTGSFQFNANGSFTYTPVANFFGVSSFTYRARDAQSLGSNVATVTIYVGLAAPTHTADWPSGVNPFTSTSPNLNWNPVTGATFYTVQVSKSADFGPDTTFDACYPNCGSVAKISSEESNTLIFQTFNTSVVANGLKGNVQYYWRVRAEAQNGEVKSDWSQVRSFITVPVPGIPILVAPNNNTTGIPTQAALSWLPANNAQNYQVQVSVNTTFDITQVDITTGTTAYTTPALSGGPVYYWRVRSVGIGGTSEWSDVYKFTRAALVSIDDDKSGIPTDYALDQNYPNPFNPSTTISFRLPETANVTLEVYTLQGQLVGSLINNATRSAGVHTVSFDATKLSSGVYMYRIVAGSYTATNKMVLVK